jgi:hypothetical protein
MGLQKNIILSSLFCFFFLEISSQVGIGTTTPDTSSILDVQSSNSGVLIPRIALKSSTDVLTISAPTESLLIYNTDTIADVFPGFYFWNGTQWSRLNDSSDENSNKVYGEIYKNSPEVRLRTAVPIEFGTDGIIQNISADTNSFLIPKSGIYRISYAISVVMRGPSTSLPVTLGFYLGTASPPTPADRIPGSFCHTRVTLLGNSSCSMTKIIHLNENQRIYLFTDNGLSILYVIPESAVMNIELIKAD